MIHERDDVDNEVMFVDGHAHINDSSIPVPVWTMAVNGIPL